MKLDVRLVLLLLLVVQSKMDTFYISQEFMLAPKIVNSAHLKEVVLNVMMAIHMLQHINLAPRHHVHLVNIMMEQIINAEIANQIVKLVLQPPFVQTVILDFI